MQYGSGQGEPAMREEICEVMRLEGISAHPDDVTVTVGSQQGLDLVTRMFCDPGRRRARARRRATSGPSGCSGPTSARSCTWPWTTRASSRRRWPRRSRRCSAAGKRVKFLYTIPNFHNPAGVSQSLDRRTEILRVAEQADLLVVEDNPYGLLGFDGDPTPAMRSLDADRVVYLGSFSKTFAPGFRVGWVLAPHAVREKLVLAQESATLCPPTFSQFAVTAYLANHDWRGQIKVFREMYRERRDAMLAGLPTTCRPARSWTVPARRLLRLGDPAPRASTAHAMLPRAVTARVAYVPGTAFYADGFGSRHMRLSYCYPTPERILEGTRRLGEVLQYEAGVLATFGTRSHRRRPRPRPCDPYEAPGANQDEDHAQINQT